MFCRKSVLFALAAVILLIVGAISLGTGSLHRADDEPLSVVRAYLKASYARDSSTAYRYISAPDQRVWDAQSYGRQNGSFTGFALKLARKLADSMKVWVIDQQISSDRVHYEVGYQAPTADELSSGLFDWDQDKLNALSRPQQEQLLEALEKMKKIVKLITIKGQETFDLIADGGRWKIFYDWASANKVDFKVALPPAAGIDAQLFNHELLVKKDEPFQIMLKIKNRSNQALVARIVHHIEPRAMDNNIDMIACGALLPLALQPGDVQEISSVYVLRDGVRPGMKLAVTYEFKLEPMPENSGLTNTSPRSPPSIAAGG